MLPFTIHLSIHRITQVPRQTNTKDCGCFMTYFAKNFFSDPEATMTLIKVVSLIYSIDLN